MDNIWKYIKADSFFRDFLPDIRSHKFKIRGFNSRGNPIDFTPDEVRQINEKLNSLKKLKCERRI